MLTVFQYGDIRRAHRDGIVAIGRFIGAYFVVGPLPLVVASSMTYAPTHEMTGLTHTNGAGAVLASYAYTFDLAGQLTSQTENSNSSTFTYDPRGNLARADHSNRAPEIFSWDANGNPTGNTTVGGDNRLHEDANFTYEYDADGNRTKKTDKATGTYTIYTYDYHNRLKRVEIHAAGGGVLHEASYTFDVFDRRIAQEVDGNQTWTAYAGDTAWADYDANGNVVARYLAGERPDELYARWRPGEGTAWYLQDRMFSVRDVTNAQGQAIDHLEYDPFGVVLSETNASAGDRFKYTGREYDATTGLYHYRARAYDPQTKRFLQEDPTGFDAGDTNLYRYVFNVPTVFRDPTGNSAMAEYGIQLSLIIAQVLGPSGDAKICLSEATTRLVYEADFAAADLDAAVGIVIAPYGLPVPKTGQVTFCVESCADLIVTAFANGIFGIMAMQLDFYNTLYSEHGTVLEQTIEYAEPDEAMGFWKLRISASCGQKKLQALADGRGPQPPTVPVGFLPSNTVTFRFGSTHPEEGATNARRLPRVKPTSRGKGRLKRGLEQKKVAPVRTRRPRDINVNPTAPPARPTNRPIGRSPTQNAALQADIAAAQAARARNIRVDQQQVNAAGQRVGTNRPDLQYTDANGRRVCVEYDTSTSTRGPAHRERILANDPNGTVILRTVD